MGKFTVERWRCDRCLTEAPKWLKPGTSYEVRVGVDYGTAGGGEIQWAEMCATCNASVAKEIEAMKASALATRAALNPEGGSDGQG